MPSESGVRDESGQALVETALVVVIVLLLLGGLIEFGWAYFRYLALQNAAGEGAAYGMMFPTYWQGDDASGLNYNCDPNNITYRVKNESQSNILDWQSVQVQVTSVFTRPDPGQAITVTASFDHRLITPLVSQFGDASTITLRAIAVQTVIAPPPPPGTNTCP